MKTLRKATYLIFLFCICFQQGMAQSPKAYSNTSMQEISGWFDAWQLVWRSTYQLNEIIPVEFVLFDDQYVYTNSPVTGKHGTTIKGPDLLNQHIHWVKKEHHDSLTLPNGQRKKVGIMSFASQTDNGTPFFVMPLTAVWKQNNLNDHGIGAENFVTCIFLHEFGHTQQLPSLRSIDTVMQQYNKAHPDDTISDNMMQQYYERDTLYLGPYLKETGMFRTAAFATGTRERLTLTKGALALVKTRQANCSKKDHRDIATIDNFFLTLEGVGQFTAYLWLIHPNGARMSEADARTALKTSWWSQEEGLDMLILLSRFIKPNELSRLMFDTQHISAMELLGQQATVDIHHR